MSTYDGSERGCDVVGHCPILGGRMGWPGDRVTASVVSRKVRAPQDEVVGNAHPG
jgi:hypothetical protein